MDKKRFEPARDLVKSLFLNKNKLFCFTVKVKIKINGLAILIWVKLRKVFTGSPTRSEFGKRFLYQTSMEAFINSVNNSLREHNWYAALTVTLTLPDIAGKIDAQAAKSTEKTYANWFDKYVGDKYETEQIGYVPVGQVRGKKIWLSGSDCYALRCAFLHEGSSTITGHQAQTRRNVLDDFIFIAPTLNLAYKHLNQFDRHLLLEVDVFCLDIIKGLEAWLIDIHDDTSKQAALANLLKIFEIRVMA